MARTSLRGILRKIPVEGSGTLHLSVSLWILSTALVQNEVGFAGFEAWVSGTTVANNYYHWDATPVRPKAPTWVLNW
jgi:hypothetical protein